MIIIKRKGVKVYLMAAAITLLLCFVRLEYLDDLLKNEAPFLLFFLAVIASSLYGGLRGGIFSTVLSTICVIYFFMEPRFSFVLYQRPVMELKLFIFIFNGTIISIVAGALLDSIEKLRLKQSELELQINDQLKTRQIMSEREERIRTLGDNLPSGAIYQVAKDESGNNYFTYMSAGIEQLVDVTPAEAMADPMKLYGLIMEEDSRRMLQEEARCQAELKPFDFQFRMKAKYNRVKWVQCRSAPRMLPDGQVVWDGIIMDITEHKKSEERIAALNADLRSRINEFETLLQVIPVGIGVSRDVECSDIKVNPAFINMLQAEESWSANTDIKKRKFKVIQNGKMIPANKLPMPVAAKEGKVFSGEEFEVMFEDGTEINLLEYAAPLLDEGGKPRGSVGIFIDITERKKAEEALREADRRKNEFLAILAHELRNPLAPIRNSLAIMKMTEEKKIIADSQAIIERQLKQMVRLIDDLLDLSRITRGKIELRIEETELSSIIQNAVETVKPLIQDMQHELVVRIPDDSIKLKADPARLSQVFGNILTNAAKYTPAGGRIEVLVDHSADLAVVHFKDNGIGIPVDKLQDVFEMFSQVDQSLERSQGGLGIGLTLVKTLVEMHGGKIHAESEGTGKGSEFIIHLPLTAKALQANAGSEGREMEESGKKYRVMVVDDNLESAKTMGWIMELLGHEVQLAHEGNSAIALANSFNPQVVLLDIGLPGMNGYDICETLRKDEKFKDTIFIAQTGWGQEEHKKRSKEAGFDHHLVKPIDIEAVKKILG